MNTNERTDKRPVWRGELALLIVILINSFGVVLMLDSGAGISAISSVPYAFSESLPGSDARNLDLYFSGNSRSGPHDLTEKVCSYIPLQLRCRLRLQ